VRLFDFIEKYEGARKKGYERRKYPLWLKAIKIDKFPGPIYLVFSIFKSDSFKELIENKI